MQGGQAARRGQPRVGCRPPEPCFCLSCRHRQPVNFGRSPRAVPHALSTDDLTRSDLDLSEIDPPPTGRHDIFGTANFFNNAPFAEAVDLINSTGVPEIYEHNDELAAQLVNGLDPNRFEVQDRGDTARLSSMIFARPLESSVDEVARRLASAGIDVAHRRGMVRLSPHFYNTPAEIDHALDVMN